MANIYRLMVLAERLEALDAARRAGKKLARKFNLRTWYTTKEGQPQRLKSCGTTACAVGEACFIPEFKDAGLGLSRSRFCGIPVFEGTDSFYAVESFFNLSTAAAEFLFSDVEYPRGERTTAKQVATRIREFARNVSAGVTA
jgi:hypothetical protein